MQRATTFASDMALEMLLRCAPAYLRCARLRDDAGQHWKNREPAGSTAQVDYGATAVDKLCNMT